MSNIGYVDLPYTKEIMFPILPCSSTCLGHDCAASVKYRLDEFILNWLPATFTDMTGRRV